MVYARAEKRERSQKRAAQEVPREWRANNPVSHVDWNQTKQRAARTSVWFIYKFLKGPVIFRIFFYYTAIQQQSTVQTFTSVQRQFWTIYKFVIFWYISFGQYSIFLFIWTPVDTCCSEGVNPVYILVNKELG